jgi:hypothetical protein
MEEDLFFILKILTLSMLLVFCIMSVQLISVREWRPYCLSLCFNCLCRYACPLSCAVFNQLRIVHTYLKRDWNLNQDIKYVLKVHLPADFEIILGLNKIQILC